MNKKWQNIELKIYELLGVKIFRKMAFGLYKIIGFPFTIFMSKEKRKEFYNKPNNYNMKKGHGIQDLRDFENMLLLNACIHICALITCIPNFLNIISGTISLSATIETLISVGVNFYCIMLQRYNHIRINQVIKRKELREEIKNSKLKEKLVKEDEHTYIVVNRIGKEKNITLDQLLEMATYDELKQYREYLLYFKEISHIPEGCQNYYNQESQSSISIALQKNKILKLKSKNKSSN